MIERIREALRRNGADAILLTDEKNRRYVTGFHSTAGAVYVSERRAVFYTDFRYIEAAKSMIKNCEVRQICSGETYSSVINMLCREDGVRTIALEDDCLTHRDYCSWEKALHAKAEPQHDLMNILRTVKSDRELDCIIKAQRIAEKAFEEILNDIKPGVTEREIAARLTYKMLHYGAENMSFDPIVVSGANSSRPHGVPSDKPIENGEFVTMDFGCIYEGYCSDMTRTIAVGSVTNEMRTVYDLVLRAQKAGIGAARAGVTGREVDAAARDLISSAGYGDCFGHGFGHGVGLYIHEAPNAAPSAQKPLPAGSILTAEPGIYLEGRFGVRIEDMLYLTEDGCRNLTEAPKNLIVL